MGFSAKASFLLWDLNQLKATLPMQDDTHSERRTSTEDYCPCISVQVRCNGKATMVLFLVVFAKLFAKQTVYKPPSKQAVGFVSKTLHCTLFWAYTIVPSNVSLPDCKSDMFSFWTSMPPDETVICNQMNDKLMEKNKISSFPAFMHAMWSSGHILKFLGAGILCILFALCMCSNMELTWRWGRRNNLKKKKKKRNKAKKQKTTDIHSKWCQLHQESICPFPFWRPAGRKKIAEHISQLENNRNSIKLGKFPFKNVLTLMFYTKACEVLLSLYSCYK